MNILITGGAGFIGSHVADRLLAQGHFVVCADNLSLGKIANIAHHKNNPRFRFIKLDAADLKQLRAVFKRYRFGCVFHLAANSDIQAGAKYLDVDFKNTLLTTFTTLRCMKEFGVKQLVFASSSAVYGELDKPLKEETGPLFPISYYGAAKLASEGFISAFCENCGIKAWIIRFPNVVGERTTHGVILDFINRLKKNPKELLILGDGSQKKPYLYVQDLVEAILFVWKKAQGKVNCLNAGVSSASRVSTIARIVVEEMGLKKVKFKYTGGDRGWVGDVPRFSYSLSKIHSLGWKASRTSDEAVRLAARACIAGGDCSRVGG